MKFRLLLLTFSFLFLSLIAESAEIKRVEYRALGEWKTQSGILDLGFSSETDTIRISISQCKQMFALSCRNPMIRNITPQNIVGGRFEQSEDIFGKKCWMINPTDEFITVELKLDSKFKRSIPFSVQSISENIGDRNTNYMLIGLYIGLVSLIIIFNLGSYIITRERQFRNYILMLLTVFLAQLSVIGLGAGMIESVFQIPESNFVVISANLSVFGSLFFAYFFIDRSPHRKIFKVIAAFLVSASLISLVLYTFDEVTLAYRILDFNNMITALLILAFAFFSIEYTSRETSIFFIAWGIFCLGAICFILKDIGLLPWNNFTQYCMIVASGIETILVSVAIGYKFFLINKEHQLTSLNLELALVEKDNIYRELKSSNQDNLLLQMELSQTKLNPHFISNCLNGIGSIIAMGNTTDARKYIIRFGRLMRGLLHKDAEDRILLYEECILLHAYCSMEQFRTMNKFEISIAVQENNDLFDLMIPKMILQPLIENSILHGLTHLKSRKPKLNIDFNRTEKEILKVTIEDNGIGRDASRKRNAERTRSGHESVGIELISQRLKMLLAGLDLEPIVYEDLIDSNGKALGTRVTIFLPHYGYPHKHPKRGDNPFKNGFNFQLSQ